MSRPGSRGFTLLEAVVALAVLGTAAVGALEALGGAVRGAERARSATTAAALATERLAAVALLPVSALDPLPDSVARGTFGPPFDTYSWRADARPVMDEADLYDVRVVVEGAATSYALATRVYRPRPVLRGIP